MSLKLEQGKYYLIKHKNEILEIKVERLTENYTYIKIISRDQNGVNFYNKWVYLNDFYSQYTDEYYILEELDITWYRKEKLERIINEK